MRQLYYLGPLLGPTFGARGKEEFHTTFLSVDTRGELWLFVHRANNGMFT